MKDRDVLDDRVPPNDLEAEQAVLGAFLLDPRLLDRLAWLSPDLFFHRPHQLLLAELRALWRESRTCDLLLIRNRLRDKGLLDQVGVAYLGELATSVPTTLHVDDYARIVGEKARSRAIIHACSDGLREAMLGNQEADALGTEIERRLKVARDIGRVTTEETTGDLMIRALDYARSMQANRSGAGVVFTGLQSFDVAVGGFFPGEMTVIAARPGVGKSSFAAQIAKHNVLSGKHAYCVSLEMRSAEWAFRAAANDAGVSSQAFRMGTPQRQHWQALTESCNRLSSSGGLLRVNNHPRISTDDIRSECYRLRDDGKLSVVVVDYLQRLRPVNARVNRYEQIGDMTRELKCLAVELHVPVLVIAALGRASETEQPAMRHLRESGDIEFDSDSIMFLYPTVRDRPDGSKQPCTAVDVAKNRNGPTTLMHLGWRPEFTQFYDLV